jgi:membrane fusion protein, heavy metal efflux system
MSLASISRVRTWLIAVVPLMVVVAIYTFIHVHDVAADEHVAGASAPRDSTILRYPANAPQLAAIQVQPAVAVPLPAGMPSNARITYDENRTAPVSSSISGRVTALLADVGQTVRKGDALLEIDSPDLASAQADVTKAVADELHKRQAVDRIRDLQQSQTASLKDLESAQADYLQAAAETVRARQRLQNLGATDVSNGKYILRAPISGVVTAKHVNPGIEVRPDLSDPLFTISDFSQLWAIVDLSDKAAASVSHGQAVEIDVDAWPSQGFPGHVELVNPTVDPTTRRVQVRCVVENQSGKLKPEMFARVSFVNDSHHLAIRVPNASLVLQGTQQFVVVEQEPGVFVRKRVNVTVNGPDTSYIESGIVAGEKIVTEGALLLNSEFPDDVH